MTDTILVFNAGSSSIKFALFAADERVAAPLIRGKIAGIKRAPDFMARDADGNDLAEDGLAEIDPSASHGELTMRLLDWLRDHDHGTTIVAAGHRVVHGGRRFSGPVAVVPSENVHS